LTTSSLSGTWKLKSFEVRTASDSEKVAVGYPFGRDPKGYLVITPDGYFSVCLMVANRPAFASGDILGGTTEEKVSAAEGYISYAGPYAIVDENKIQVQVEVSFFPNWVGGVQERFFEVRGSALELSTPPLLAQGRRQTARLMWELVSKKP
jgi:hypothetical protein